MLLRVAVPVLDPLERRHLAISLAVLSRWNGLQNRFGCHRVGHRRVASVPIQLHLRREPDLQDLCFPPSSFPKY